MQAEADVAVEDGEDGDFKEDHEAQHRERDCYPSEGVLPRKCQPYSDADVA